MQSIMERRQSCFHTQCICGVRKKVGQTNTYNIGECVPQRGTHRTISIQTKYKVLHALTFAIDSTNLDSCTLVLPVISETLYWQYQQLPLAEM